MRAEPAEIAGHVGLAPDDDLVERRRDDARVRSSSRAAVEFVSWSDGDRCKFHPIADWTDRDVHRYLKAHNLPYHSLWEKGYVLIGDMHSTRPLHEVEHIDQTRFAGLKRECGLHEINLSGL